MLIYDSIETANEAESLQIRPRGTPGSSEIHEADWGYRLRGHGMPGGRDGGWLLTFQYTQSAPAGTLIAYEIRDDERTGRVGIVRRDWQRADDQRHLDATKQQLSQPWQGANMQPGGEADLEEIDELLPGQKL